MAETSLCSVDNFYLLTFNNSLNHYQMKRLTSLLIAMIAVAFAMEINAGPDSYKVRTRAANPQIYQTKPDPFKQVGDSKMYYSIAMRYFWNSEDEYTAKVMEDNKQ